MQFIRASALCGSQGVYFGAMARAIPLNTGIVVDSEGLSLSWLTQITSCKGYNDVSHLKVEAPSNCSFTVEGASIQTSFSTDYYYYGYRRIEFSSSGSEFTFRTYYSHDANIPKWPVEILTGRQVNGCSFHVTVTSVNDNNRVVDFGVVHYRSVYCDAKELPTTRSYYAHLLSDYSATFTEQDRFDVVAEVIDSLKTGSNQLENLSGLVDLVMGLRKPGKGLLEFIDKLKDLLDAGAVKSASKAWLAYRYAYQTTMLDIQQMLTYYGEHRNEILDEVYTNGSSRLLRSGSVSGNTAYNCQFRLRPRQYNHAHLTHQLLASACDKLYVRASSLGVAPTMENIWDLIPLSFVVDWIIPIGDVLGRISDERFYECFDIYDFGESFKTTVDTNVSGIPVHITQYYRHACNPPRGEFISEDPSTGTSTKRIIDGTALLINS